jgi:hypothetical protein
MSRTKAARVFVPTVRRGPDWFERRCPECGRSGRVAIYPGRAEESLRYIASPNWRCLRCQRLQQEVERAQEDPLEERCTCGHAREVHNAPGTNQYDPAGGTPCLACGCLCFKRQREETMTGPKQVNWDERRARLTLVGPQEPPQDEGVFNRRQPDGTFRPLADFFSRGG